MHTDWHLQRAQLISSGGNHVNHFEICFPGIAHLMSFEHIKVISTGINCKNSHREKWIKAVNNKGNKDIFHSQSSQMLHQYCMFAAIINQTSYLLFN